MKQTRLESFKKYFTQYQKRFGLEGYSVYFQQCVLSDCHADITTDHYNMLATVRVNSTGSEGRKLKDTAKHEALHLLLGEIMYLARNRYISEDILYSAEEQIVYKLEKLID